MLPRGMWDALLIPPLPRPHLVAQPLSFVGLTVPPAERAISNPSLGSLTGGPLVCPVHTGVTRAFFLGYVRKDALEMEAARTSGWTPRVGAGQ